MKKHTIKKIAAFFSLTIAGIAPAMAQQNIQFTQYIFNSLSVNPAYAGYKEVWFGQLALRSQWSDISGAPKTGQLSIDGILDPEHKRMGVGLQVTSDKLGPQSAVSAYANYAYRLQLDENDTKRLSFGLGVGVTNYGLDGDVLSPVQQNDPNLMKGQLNTLVPDARLGVYYADPKFYIGLSLMDLFASKKADIFNEDPNTSQNIKRRRHMYLMTGMMINLDENIKLRPGILVKEDFKGPTSFDFSGMLIFRDKIWFGGSYRTGIDLWKKDYSQGLSLTSANSISGIAQFYASDRFRIGYSYDYSLNGLGHAGSHEITLGITLPGKAQRLLSPRFF